MGLSGGGGSWVSRAAVLCQQDSDETLRPGEVQLRLHVVALMGKMAHGKKSDCHL